LKFTIIPSTFNEEAFDKTSTADGETFVKQLAEGKANCVAENLTWSGTPQLVIGADTVIVGAHSWALITTCENFKYSCNLVRALYTFMMYACKCF